MGVSWLSGNKPPNVTNGLLPLALEVCYMAKPYCSLCRTSDHGGHECPKRFDRGRVDPVKVAAVIAAGGGEPDILPIGWTKGGRPRLDDQEPSDPIERQKWKRRMTMRSRRKVAPDPDKV